MNTFLPKKRRNVSELNYSATNDHESSAEYGVAGIMSHHFAKTKQHTARQSGQATQKLLCEAEE